MVRLRVEIVAVLLIACLSAQGARAVSIGLPGAPIGTLSRQVLPEVSGMVEARGHANVFWVHNDSGDTARFFAITRQGSLLGTFPLAGATANDWEDIAIARNATGGADLYFADIGDNSTNRAFVTIFRTPEPLSTMSATIPVGQYAAAKLQYPGGARNAESLIVDPLTGEIVIVSKGPTTEIYTAPASAFGQTMTTLTARGVLGANLETATAADISPNGRHILVRSKTAAYLFERGLNQSVADALHGPGIPFTLGEERQGEAIGWAANGASFFTTSETDGQNTAPIYQYAFTGPAPGDFDLNGTVDAVDLAAWQSHFGVDGWADANNDGRTNGEDFLLWQRSLVPAPPTVAVPEFLPPGVTASAALGLLGTHRRKRRGISAGQACRR